ncbi:hypothetical protein ACWDZ4_27225 [Streptomyces sp. NPDC003016]
MREWLAAAERPEPRLGGVVALRWPDTGDGGDAAVAHGTVTAWDPDRYRELYAGQSVRGGAVAVLRGGFGAGAAPGRLLGRRTSGYGVSFGVVAFGALREAPRRVPSRHRGVRGGAVTGEEAPSAVRRAGFVLSTVWPARTPVEGEGMTAIAPRWAVRAAHATVVVVLPSSLRRTALALGVPLGCTRRQLVTEYHAPGWGTAYMVGLSLLTEALALLTPGLVRPWGEAAPSWLPVTGGRPVGVRVVMTAARVGAAIVTFVWWGSLAALFFTDFDQAGGLAGGHYVFMPACYAPLLARGPLLAAVTVSYGRRCQRVTSTARTPRGRGRPRAA